MRKLILLTFLFIYSISLIARNDITKFLGIPINGTKSEMIKKLKDKGFKVSFQDRDALKGEFNGEEVKLYIVTDNNKVWRICVFDELTRDEEQIKIRYNKLCSQFENNEKYLAGLLNDTTYIITNNEDISYNITVNKKKYNATYFQKIDQKFLEYYYPKLIEVKNKESEQQTEEEISIIYSDTLKMYENLSNKIVWFTIDEYGSGYRILMYYDNLYNRSNGEDL